MPSPSSSGPSVDSPGIAQRPLVSFSSPTVSTICTQQLPHLLSSGHPSACTAAAGQPFWHSYRIPPTTVLSTTPATAHGHSFLSANTPHAIALAWEAVPLQLFLAISLLPPYSCPSSLTFQFRRPELSPRLISQL
ncbi:hypothetical protein MRB53_032847 [Persea americana]|uniref:Uncharacterized protein n=1 Tax=Persea americana TaxID=3435 RepID=A0ACC2KU19_PERAE|nr:hypothetical protein MRB53_032847 [Persea americana]